VLPPSGETRYKPHSREEDKEEIVMWQSDAVMLRLPRVNTHQNNVASRIERRSKERSVKQTGVFGSLGRGGRSDELD
jgi:hypothetical protein